MKSTDDKDLVVVELLKEVRVLKRQLGLVKNSIKLFSKRDIEAIRISLELLNREIIEVMKIEGSVEL